MPSFLTFSKSLSWFTSNICPLFPLISHRESGLRYWYVNGTYVQRNETPRLFTRKQLLFVLALARISIQRLSSQRSGPYGPCLFSCYICVFVPLTRYSMNFEQKVTDTPAFMGTGSATLLQDRACAPRCRRCTLPSPWAGTRQVYRLTGIELEWNVRVDPTS